MVELTETAQKVLEERYYRGGESKWEHLVHRVSHHFANTNKEYLVFSKDMNEMSWLPNSPTLMNAGTDIKAYSACYVLPIEDDIDSIFKYYSDAGKISKSGGGVGASFNNIRELNSPVGSTGGVASGPVSFMDGQDALTNVIKQGGVRRGANMGILRVDHGDIWNFIKAKDTPGRLENFNLSVGITDSFMETVTDPHMITVNGEYKIDEDDQADIALWDEIVRRAHSSAEPGVLFMDTIEAGNTVPHLGKLEATNPCLAGDTRLLTSGGYKQIKDIVGAEVSIWNGERFSNVVPFSTGINPLLSVTLSDHNILEVTPYHTFILKGGILKEAKELCVGDKLEKFQMPVVEYGASMEVDPYSQGFYSGDGSTGLKKSHLYFTKFQCADRLIGSFSLGDLTRKLWSHGKMLEKAYVPLGATISDRLNWLAGLLDADGHIQHNPNSMQLVITSIDENFLMEVKLMLTTLGVSAKVADMKDACVKNMPDGKGGTKAYRCKKSYRLLINAYDTSTLTGIGLTCERLDLSNNKPNRDARRYVTIESVVDLELQEETFCLTEPHNHTLTAEGVVIGNCGEQPLLPYESCSLASINLSNHVVALDSKMQKFEVDYIKLRTSVHNVVLFMNRVLDKSEMPIPECQEAMEQTRKIGIGFAGLDDMLIKLGLAYDSEEGRALAESVMKFIAKECDIASTELGNREGVYDETAHRRNANLTTIAPTGTLSMLMGVSSGCEPYYAPITYKTVLDGTTFCMPCKPLLDMARDLQVKEEGSAWVSS